MSSIEKGLCVKLSKSFDAEIREVFSPPLTGGCSAFMLACMLYSALPVTAT